MSRSVEVDAFRRVMRRVPSPVTVVTSSVDGDRYGMTAGSFTSVSLEPPLVSFNVTRNSGMYGVIGRADRCAVHFLREEQVDLAHWFARSDLTGEAQFEEVAHREIDGLPLLEGTLGILEADIEAEHPAGDTALFVARVERIRELDLGGPLLYFSSSYRSIGEVAE